MRHSFLLDTCAALWTTNPDPRFVKAEAEIERQMGEGARVMLSPITAWEVGMLAARGRVALSREPMQWFSALLDGGVELAPMPPDILIDASYLPYCDLRDPGDRVIAATARALGLTVVTRDSKILAYAEAGWLSALEC